MPLPKHRRRPPERRISILRTAAMGRRRSSVQRERLLGNDGDRDQAAKLADSAFPFASRSQQDHSEPELLALTPPQPTSDDSSKARPTLFKGWRPLAFLLIAAFASLTGFHFKSLGNPGSEDEQFANQPPQTVDVFVSNPRISVQVNAAIQQGSSTIVSYYAMVEMPATVKSGRLLVLSDWPADQSTFYPLSSPSKHAQIAGEPDFDGYYASEIALSRPRERPIAPRTLRLGTFYTRAVVDVTKAAIYGHLPSIEDLDYADTRAPAALGEEEPHASKLRDVVADPVPKNGKAEQLPATYSTPYDGTAELFWTPNNFSVNETLGDALRFFRYNQLTSITPPGTFSGEDYVWHSSSDLEPTFESTNESAAEAETSDAFLSGIIFGVAGAASIALVQEIPETFSMPAWRSHRKRRSKVPSQAGANSNGI